MTEKRSLICIACPLGCGMDIVMGNGMVKSVKGNGCKKGVCYAQTECTNPTRILTTTMRVEKGKYPLVPVKSEKGLPKHLLMECMEAVNNLKATAPVHIGDILVENILNSGINIAATNNVEKLAE